MALSGILAVLVAGLDIKSTLGGKHHYLLYCLTTAMQPRMLMTVDEDSKMMAVPCRYMGQIGTIPLLVVTLHYATRSTKIKGQGSMIFHHARR